MINGDMCFRRTICAVVLVIISSINGANAVLDFDCADSLSGSPSSASLPTEFATAKLLSERSFYQGSDLQMPSISSLGELDYYRFNASEDGEYQIESVGNIDLAGTLYLEEACASTVSQLAYDQDSGISQNFRIKHVLESGKTYYIKVASPNDQLGLYNLRVIPPSGFPANNNSSSDGLILIRDFNRYHGWVNPVEKVSINGTNHQEDMSSKTAYNYLSLSYENTHGVRHIGTDIHNDDSQAIYSIGRGEVYKSVKHCSSYSYTVSENGVDVTKYLEPDTDNLSHIFVRYNEGNAHNGDEFVVVYGHTEPLDMDCSQESNGLQTSFGSRIVGPGDKIGLTKTAGEPDHLHLGMTLDTNLAGAWGRRNVSFTDQNIFDQGWRDPLSFIERMRGTVEPQFFNASAEMSLLNSESLLSSLAPGAMDPNRNLTRLQAVNLIADIYLRVTGQSLAQSISSAANNNPQRLISREELLLLIARVLNSGANPENQINNSSYQDLPDELDDFIDFRNAILFAYENDIFLEEKNWTRINSSNIVPVYRAAKWLLRMKNILSESFDIACGNGTQLASVSNFALLRNSNFGASCGAPAPIDPPPEPDPTSGAACEINARRDLDSSDALTLSEGTRFNANRLNASINLNDGDLYKFVPSRRSNYLFQSERYNHINLHAELLDSSFKVINADCENSYIGGNFRVSSNLTANQTYYLLVRSAVDPNGQYQSSGSYRIVVSDLNPQQEINDPNPNDDHISQFLDPAGSNAANLAVLDLGANSGEFEIPGDVDFFHIDNDLVDGSFTLESQSGLDLKAEIFETCEVPGNPSLESVFGYYYPDHAAVDAVRVTSDDDSGDQFNFRIEGSMAPHISGAYGDYRCLRVSSKTGETGSYIVNFDRSFPELNDDHGDSFDTATKIIPTDRFTTFDLYAAGVFEELGDIDIFSFYVEDPGDYAVLADGERYIYDEQGSLINLGLDGSALTGSDTLLTDLSSGTYYIKLVANKVGAYTARVIKRANINSANSYQDADFLSATVIQPETAYPSAFEVQSSTGYNVGAHLYSFTVNQAATYSIKTSSSDELYTFGRLYDANANLIYSNMMGSGLFHNFEITAHLEPGAYYIKVLPWQNRYYNSQGFPVVENSATNQYQILVRTVADALIQDEAVDFVYPSEDLALISSQQTVNGSINFTGDQDFYKFVSPVDTNVTFWVATLSPVALEVYDDQGVYLGNAAINRHFTAFAKAGTENFIKIKYPATGLNTNGVGKYQFSIFIPNTSVTPPQYPAQHYNDYTYASYLKLNKLTDGAFYYSHDKDYLRFKATVDDIYNIETSGEQDTLLTLYENTSEEVDNVSLAEIAQDDNSGLNTNAKIEIALDADQIYYIKAEPINQLINNIAPYQIIARIKPNQSPQASFVMNPASNIVVDQVIAMDASASVDYDGQIVSYSWDFGDAQTAIGANVNHSYAHLGEYTVALTVTDDRGATSTISKTIVCDDHGDDIDHASLILLDQEISAVMFGADQDYFSINIVNPGAYQVESFGDSDVRVGIINSQRHWLASNDNSSGHNFKASADLAPGLNYIMVGRGAAEIARTDASPYRFKVAEYTDDHINEIGPSATTVTMSTNGYRPNYSAYKNNNYIEYANDADVYQFHVALQSTYTLTTYNNDDLDLSGELYDSDGNLIGSQDHYGYGKNFLIVESLPVGNYYLKVINNNQNTGTYHLSIDGLRTFYDDHSNYPYNGTPLVAGELIDARINYPGHYEGQDADCYQFVPEENMNALWSFAGQTFAGDITLYQMQPYQVLDSVTNSARVNLQSNLEAGNRYAFCVRANYTYGNGPYKLLLGELEQGDDIGNSDVNAIELSLGQEYQANIHTTTDEDFFFYKVYSNAGMELIFESSGGLDTMLELYDTQGNLLISDDNSGDANNSKITYTLDPYKHYSFYLKASARSIGNYGVLVSEGTPPDDHADYYTTTLTKLRRYQRINGNLGHPGDVDWFELEVPYVGYYTIRSEGATNTLGQYHLKYPWYPHVFPGYSDDNSGPGNNFEMRLYLVPGYKYLISVRHPSSGTGTYQLFMY